MKKLLPVILLVALAVLGWTNKGRIEQTVHSTQQQAEQTTPLATGSPLQVNFAQITKAKAQLAALPVKPQASMKGYDRDKFRHWVDPDANGCDAREDALQATGVDVKTGKGCKVLSGSWTDPYGGEVFTNPRQLDVDHIVPLANAWRSGAGSWTPAKRERFANDPRNLLAVAASLNRQKGDKGPEVWLPPTKAVRQGYAVHWIGLKSVYGLSVTKAEQTRLMELLG